MINIDELYIVNYCHPNCVPLKNILRLPKEEAFLLAHEMAKKNPNTTAFWRFADFKNYYSLRARVDARLYELFKSLGGKPKVKHPLSFVLQGSEYLNNWFDKGTITKILLKNIPSEYISFTYSDSCAVLDRTGEISVMTKEMLLNSIRNYEGTVDEYMSEIAEKYNYIEVQLWNDNYCINQKQGAISSES